MRIAVFGALNVDVLGSPNRDFHWRDSLPGHVTISMGGVGYNMAKRLRQLGATIDLVVPLGHDSLAEQARADAESRGLNTAHCPVFRAPHCVYLAIHDADGDMVCAINDMRLIDLMTPDILKRQARDMLRPDGVIVDANLSTECLVAISELWPDVPLFADPVSGEKAQRMLPILPRLCGFKPNQLEAEKLTGEADPLTAAKALVAQGIQHVFVSAGADGLYFASKDGAGHLPAEPLTLTSATGAGDALSAALFAALTEGLSAKEAALWAQEKTHHFLLEQST